MLQASCLYSTCIFYRFLNNSVHINIAYHKVEEMYIHRRKIFSPHDLHIMVMLVYLNHSLSLFEILELPEAQIVHQRKSYKAIW